jgi:hypothetical protein
MIVRTDATALLPPSAAAVWGYGMPGATGGTPRHAATPGPVHLAHQQANDGIVLVASNSARNQVLSEARQSLLSVSATPVKAPWNPSAFAAVVLVVAALLVLVSARVLGASQDVLPRALSR